MTFVEEELNRNGVTPENTTLGFHSNWLTVNGKNLNAAHYENPRLAERLSISSENLHRILMLGRRPILEAIEAQFVADVRPSIWTAKLGTTADSEGKGNKVFTSAGIANGGIITSPGGLEWNYRPYWQAAKKAGFLPEVRRVSGTQKGGAWLLVRKPTLLDVANSWLYWHETDAAKATRENTITKYKSDSLDRNDRLTALRVYRTVGEAAIDRISSHATIEERAHQQIGLLLGVAALRYQLNDIDNYAQDVDDIFTYADNTTSVDQTVIRAIENSMFNT